MLSLVMAVGLMTQTVPPFLVPADETTRVECEIVLAVAPAGANVNTVLFAQPGTGQPDLDCGIVFREAGLPDPLPQYRTEAGNDRETYFYSRPIISDTGEATLREDLAGRGFFMKASRYVLKLQDGRWVKIGEELIAIT